MEPLLLAQNSNVANSKLSELSSAGEGALVVLGMCQGLKCSTY